MNIIQKIKAQMEVVDKKDKLLTNVIMSSKDFDKFKKEAKDFKKTKITTKQRKFLLDVGVMIAEGYTGPMIYVDCDGNIFRA